MSETMNAYSLFESDADAETSGVWVPIADMKFKLARAGGLNDNFAKAVTKTFKPYQAAVASDTMPKELALELVINVFVDTVLLGWENVKGRDGAAIEYSKASAKKLLTELPNLFLKLQEEATKLSNFRKESLEIVAGN